jgi:DNA-binding LytR/AlgR family response regulator
MKQFMSRLPEHQFFRTHKSFIVNMDKIERYTPSEVEIAGELLPLSRSRKNEFQIRFSIN